MRKLTRVLVASLASLALLAWPVTAHAQDDEPSAPTATPPPSSSRAASGEFVAPLSQQTQRTYVPQSVALSGPAQLANWKDGDPVPDGYHKSTRVRRGAIVAGAVCFGTLYLFSLLAASIAADSAKTTTYTTGPNGTVANTTTSANPDAALYIPALGPFIQMGSTSSATGNFFLAIDGLGQTVGIALIVYGITSPQTVLVRNDLARPRVLPIRIGKDGYGLGLHAEF
jgi:hypothetical protein